MPDKPSSILVVTDAKLKSPFVKSSKMTLRDLHERKREREKKFDINFKVKENGQELFCRLQ